MKKILLLLFLASAMASFSEEQVFFCGFEENEGYELGAITGQNDWTELFSHTINQYEVTNKVSFTGDQSLYVYGPREGGDTGIKKVVEYENPYHGKIFVSYMLKPADRYVRLYFYDAVGGDNHRIAVVHINTHELYIDAGGTWNGGDPDLSVDEWYKVTLLFDPVDNVLEEFTLGDDITLDEIRNYCDEAASGDIGSFAIRTGWNDPTDAWVDDITIELIPEPACMGLLALAGFLFLRKRS
jgi:hypothetical protein